MCIFSESEVCARDKHSCDGSVGERDGGKTYLTEECLFIRLLRRMILPLVAGPRGPVIRFVAPQDISGRPKKSAD